MHEFVAPQLCPQLSVLPVSALNADAQEVIVMQDGTREPITVLPTGNKISVPARVPICQSSR